MTVRTPVWALGLILLAAVSARPQQAPPASPSSAPAPAQHPLAPSFEAVRRGWFVPEAEARAFFAEFHPSLVEFALTAALRHETGKTLEEIHAEERAAEGWPALLRKLGGPFAALVFQGGARYGLEPLPAADAVQAPAVEERIRLLAQVTTLERLTGDGPMAIRRELDAGRSFESLLLKNQPQTEESPRRSAPERGEGHRRNRGQALLGGGPIGPKPGNSGFVETGGAPPPSTSGNLPPR